MPSERPLSEKIHGAVYLEHFGFPGREWIADAKDLEAESARLDDLLTDVQTEKEMAQAENARLRKVYEALNAALSKGRHISAFNFGEGVDAFVIPAREWNRSLDAVREARDA